MEKTFISWNIENWITVMLMAAAGYLVFVLLTQLAQRQGVLKAAA